MRILRYVLLTWSSAILVLGASAIAGGCGGNAEPPRPTVSPYEQAKASFDAYKEEIMKRKTNRR